MPASPSAVPSTSPVIKTPLRVGVEYSVESLKLGARKSSMVSSKCGIWISPMPTDPSASTAIATRIGSARSAIACTGPGKPTSVSSASPVSGLRGTSAWCGCPACISRASDTGSPWKARKIMRNV